MKRIWRSCTAMLMALCLVFGLCSNGLVVLAADLQVDDEINYVSIGDSMANGYGFEGYCQGSDACDFLNGINVYGEGSYALQFEDYLAGKGYEVNHTKLASSALRAEDLYYLLGGYDAPVDQWFGQVEHYTGIEDDAVLSAFYQEAVKNADVITLGIGNASFGAFMLQYVTNAIGLMGNASSVDPNMNLENGLALLESEEDKQTVLDIYADLMAELNAVIPTDLADKYPVEDVCNIVAYTAAGFILNYKAVVEKILELNPDCEVILVGLMNTTYGMTLSGEGVDAIPVGDYMDNVFSVLNAYIAAVPTVLQANGDYEEATFYYAEQPNPKFIVQAFDDLANAGWDNIDCGADDCGTEGHDCGENGRLSSDIVRERQITAYNEGLRTMIAAAFSNDYFTMHLDVITLADVEAFEANNPGWAYSAYGYGFTGNGDDTKNMSVAIYLGIERAVVNSVDTMDITIDGLESIADINALMGVFTGLSLDATNPSVTPNDVADQLATYLTSTETLRAMCKIYALFKVGNGMSVHPTPAGHDDLFEAICDAYENEHTAQKQTIDNLIYIVTTYYDEAYEYAYDYAEQEGYIAEVLAGIDAAIEAVEGVDLTAVEMTEEFRAEAEALKAEILESLEEAKALVLEADVLDEASLNALLAVLGEAAEDMEALADVLVQTGVDVNNLVVIPALQAAHEHLVNVVIPTAVEKLTEAVEVGTAWLLEKAHEAYVALINAAVEALKEAAPEVADAVYDYLYNNPEKVVDFFVTYGPYVGELCAEYGDEALVVVVYLLYNYGDEVVAFIIENHEEIIEHLVAWWAVHGDNTIALIQVYAEYLGLCDAVCDQMAALKDVLAEVENSVNGVIAEVEAKIAEIEEKIEELKAQLEELKSQLEELKAELEEKKAQLENAAEELKAEIEAKIAEIEAAIAKIEAAVAELEAAIVELNAEVEALVEELKNLDIALDQLDEALKNIIKTGAEEGLQAALDALADALVELVGYVSEETAEELAALIEEVKALLNELYIDGTTDNFLVSTESHYVALGDADAYGAAADILAEELTEFLGAEVAFDNLTNEGLTAAAVLELLPTYAETLSDADLVTIGFSANTFTNFTVNQLMATLAEQPVAEMNWTELLGEQGAAYVEEMLSELHAEFEGQEPINIMGKQVDVADFVTLVIESYAYAYSQHAISYIQVIEGVHAINPDAQVVLVGMYNPLAGVTLKLGENEIAVGEYLQYVVDLSNYYSLGYAMVVPQTIYVDAPAVETSVNAGAYDVLTFASLVLYFSETFNPTEAGHDYIEDQIWNALNVHKEGLLGDADGDCDVDNYDAMLVMRYHVGLIGKNELDLNVSDVDGDGDVDNYDAMLIMRKHVGLIEVFPAED